MTTQQIAWAMSHDWFMGTVEVAAGMMVVVRDDMSERFGTLTFIDFQKLKQWAGY